MVSDSKIRREHSMTGLVQVYTGEGKGKTTAALGLAMRAAGAGLTVLFAQFLKKGEFSEITILRERFPEIAVRQYGAGAFITGTPTDCDRVLAAQGFSEISQAVRSGDYDMVILDECNYAVALGLVQIENILTLIEEKPSAVELVFTGRDAHPLLVERADMVTDMRAVKHCHDSGIHARKGIEY
jgi:cob(I)alamin adenosyltransferase